MSGNILVPHKIKATDNAQLEIKKLAQKYEKLEKCIKND